MSTPTRRVAERKDDSNMMSNPLTEIYIRWLELQFQDATPGQSYWDLLNIMYMKVFIWLIPNDDNRIADGRELRIEFCHAQRIRPNYWANSEPISFLEVLLGLSRRLAFTVGDSSEKWAWQLVINLELENMFDTLSVQKKRKVINTLDTVIGRTYQFNGVGGFFPLIRPSDDQTQVELWYQMAAYIDEMRVENNY